MTIICFRAETVAGIRPFPLPFVPLFSPNVNATMCNKQHPFGSIELRDWLTMNQITTYTLGDQPHKIEEISVS